MKRPNLTRRQLEVLTGLWNGDSIKEIAARLHIAESTVQTPLVKLRRRFQAKTTIELCRKMRALGHLAR